MPGGDLYPFKAQATADPRTPRGAPVGDQRGGRRIAPLDAVLDSSTSIATPPPLVTSRSNSHTPSGTQFDPETGEILETFDPTIKWQLQQVARRALGPDHRLRICYRYPRRDVAAVGVHQSKDSHRCYFSQLMTCGSVWVCPVCAAKIQSYRAAEVRSIIDAWAASGGMTAMLTQTIPHVRADGLSALLDGFGNALRKFKAGSPFKRRADRHGIEATARGLEVTWGRINGWHPHAHSLLFIPAGTDLNELRGDLFPLWESATARAGFDPVAWDAFNLQGADAVRTYITKLGTEYQWNAEHELVKAHSKRGKQDRGMTPFDFLRTHLEEPTDSRWLDRYAEFGSAFHGRNQLTWSRGFKRWMLGTDGPSDDQVADSIGKNDPLLASIGLEDWSGIRKRNLQATVLRVVELHGREGLQLLLGTF